MFSKKKVPAFASSLNRITRLRELTKVNHENQNLLKRLRNTQSNYDIRFMEKNGMDQITLMENLCRNSSKYSKTDALDRFLRDNYFVRSPSLAFRPDGYSTIGPKRLMSAQSQKRLGTPGSTMRPDKNFQRILNNQGLSTIPREDQRPGTAPHGKRVISRKQQKRNIITATTN